MNLMDDIKPFKIKGGLTLDKVQELALAFCNNSPEVDEEEQDCIMITINEESAVRDGRLVIEPSDYMGEFYWLPSLAMFLSTIITDGEQVDITCREMDLTDDEIDEGVNGYWGFRISPGIVHALKAKPVFYSKGTLDWDGYSLD